MPPESSPAPWRPDASHLDDLSAAAVAIDSRLRIRYANPAAQGLLARTRDQLIGADVVETLFPEAGRGPAGEVLAQALAGGHWTGELDLLSGTGNRRAHLSLSPVRQEGALDGALLLAEDLSAGGADRGRAHRLGERLTRLARVAAEMVSADSVEVVSKIVVNHIADAAGATVASLSLLVDEDTLALIGLRGAKEGTASRWATFPVSATLPAAESVRTGRTVVLTDRAAIDARYPDLETVTEGERSLISLPLRVAGKVIGAATLSFPGGRVFDSTELEFLGILADVSAQAIDRVHALEESADQEAKLQFLADASAELSSSLDYQATLAKVARLAVPNLADWCSISVAEDGELRTLAVAHVDPAKVALAEELQRRYPPDPESAGGAYNVLRTGVSELIPEVTDEMLVAATQDEEHLRLARELNLRSGLSVPLTARGRVLGVLSLVSADEGRRFDREDLIFAEDLAARAAIAIDNAQLHSETREAAVRLQAAVLPESLPALPGWDLASSYTPAGRTDVGGDFYDVIPLAGDRVVFFVGDVMGRGVLAAAAMAQIRSAVRAYLAIDPDPVAVADMLDRMFERFEMTQLVTLVYALADGPAGSMSVLNAGHPPPLVLRRDGTVEEVPLTGGTPLGLGYGDRSAVTVRFEPCDSFLAFTDGLIERRTEDIDEGQRRVAEAAPGLAEGNLASRLAELVDAVRDHTREDDVAALVVRRTCP